MTVNVCPWEIFSYVLVDIDDSLLLGLCPSFTHNFPRTHSVLCFFAHPDFCVGVLI